VVQPQDLNVDSDDIIFAEDPTSSQFDYIVNSGNGDDIVSLAAGDDIVFAGQGNDIVFAAGGDDTVYGGDQADRLLGGTGDDILFGEGDDDTIRGGTGSDTIFGGQGNDSLAGGAGDDTIFGGQGLDWMRGGAGNDLLAAGVGKDEMTGGSGADRFRLGRGANIELDTITDFNPNEDILQINRSLLPGSGLGNGVLDAADFEVVNKIGAGSDAKVVYESSTGLVYYNPGAGSPVALVQMGKGLNLDADAFRIV
jgi:Ca2+-binding RTX toxin-like protein